jgi:membrane protein DedA with SNARE-associated domain
MRRSRQIAGVVLVLGVWAMIAPYLGPALGFVVQQTALTEFVDHVVPAVPVLVVAAYAAATGRFPLPAALLALLCGFWMAGTHVPLVGQAMTDRVDWPSALWHSVPTLTVFVVTAAIATVAWLDERDRERQAARD